MSSSNNNKGLLIALGAAGALVSAAVIFHLFSNKQSSSQAVFEDIDALGAPKREPNGLLSFAYYKDLFVIM